MGKKGMQCSGHQDFRKAAAPSWCRDEQLQASLLGDQRVVFSQLTWEQSPQAVGWLTGEVSAGQARDRSSSTSVHYSLVVWERSHNPRAGAC